MAGPLSHGPACDGPSTRPSWAPAAAPTRAASAGTADASVRSAVCGGARSSLGGFMCAGGGAPHNKVLALARRPLPLRPRAPSPPRALPCPQEQAHRGGRAGNAAADELGVKSVARATGGSERRRHPPGRLRPPRPVSGSGARPRLRGEVGDAHRPDRLRPGSGGIENGLGSTAAHDARGVGGAWAARAPSPSSPSSPGRPGRCSPPPSTCLGA